MQCLIVTALTLVFASFSSPLLSGMFTVSLFVVGNLMSQLDNAKDALSEQFALAKPLVKVLRIVLPNFESLNLAWFVTHSERVPGQYVAAAIWYTLSYVALTLVVSIVIFSRRDLA